MAQAIAPFPARLHILLASAKPVGVVIRRGPSKQVCTLLWNRKTDEFTLAQWLKGRIYERRSDLSSDGRYMIYFAMNGQWQSATGGSWTVISRAPWLKAIALYGKGDCWNGGGLFIGNRTYWLNGACTHRLMQASSEVWQDETYQPQAYYGGECPGVYYHRLQRDGWQYLPHWTMKASHRWNTFHVFEKLLPQGWVLRKYAHAQIDAPMGKGCYWDDHELEHPASETILSYPDWEWAEWDRNRLVWAEGGCLYGGRLKKHGLVDVALLHDFNGMSFESRCAPY